MDPTYIWVAKKVQGKIGEKRLRSKQLHKTPIISYLYSYIYLLYARSENTKDCQWDQFGPWNSCSKPCGGGAKWRKRKKKADAEKGGKPCLGERIEMVSCNNQACEGKWGISEIVCLEYFKEVILGEFQ